MLELDDADDAQRVADWLELELSLGEPSFSKSKVSSLIRDASGIEPSEAHISDIWRHLRGRLALYSAPFSEIHGDLITRRDDVTDGRLEYDVCLFFRCMGPQSKRELTQSYSSVWPPKL
jgi:hypothetical protein